MKILFIVAVVVLLAGTVLGEYIVRDPGYVLLSYEPYTIETSIWGLALVVLFSFFALHIALRGLTYLLQRGTKFRSWNQTRGRNSANRKTMKGLMALASGDWSRAQRLLTQSAEKSDLTLVNYLAAARAAQEQNLPQACDNLLLEARQSNPSAEIAISIVQAQIQLSRGQLEACQGTLNRLRRLTPRHTLVLKMLKDVHIQLKDWDALCKLLPDLRKQKVFKDDELQALEHQIYGGLLQSTLDQMPIETSQNERIGGLRKCWKSLPKHLLYDERLIGHFTTLLAQAGAKDEAENFLRESLRKNWSSALVRQYGHLEGRDFNKQFKQALQWLKLHGSDPSLLLTLGRLSMRSQDWTMAREYFERSLKLEKNSETSSELMRLLQHLDDQESYQRLLEDSLEYMTVDLPPLPMPPRKVEAKVEEPQAADEEKEGTPKQQTKKEPEVQAGAA